MPLYLSCGLGVGLGPVAGHTGTPVQLLGSRVPPCICWANGHPCPVAGLTGTPVHLLGSQLVLVNTDEMPLLQELVLGWLCTPPCTPQAGKEALLLKPHLLC